MKKLFLAAMLLAFAGITFAQSDYMLGTASLQTIVNYEDNALLLNFSSPTVNFVGFEHRPETEAEMEAIKFIHYHFRHGNEIFVPSHAAACQLTNVDVHTGDADSFFADDFFAEDEETTGDGFNFLNLKSLGINVTVNTPGVHVSVASETSAEGQGVGVNVNTPNVNVAVDSQFSNNEDNMEEDDERRLFTASYMFACANISELHEVDTSTVFATYSNLKDLDVQYILPAGSYNTSLNAQNSVLRF